MSLASTLDHFDILNSDFTSTVERLEKIADELVGKNSKAEPASQVDSQPATFSMINILASRVVYYQDLNTRLCIAVSRIEEGVSGADKVTGGKAAYVATLSGASF